MNGAKTGHERVYYASDEPPSGGLGADARGFWTPGDLDPDSKEYADLQADLASLAEECSETNEHGIMVIKADQVERVLGEYKTRGIIGVQEGPVSGKVVSLGRLSEDPWPGAVSLDNRLANEEGFDEDTLRYFEGLISLFYRPVTPGANMQCVAPQSTAGFDPFNPNHPLAS